MSRDANKRPGGLALGNRVAAIDIGTNSVLLTIAEVVASTDSASGFGLSALDERATITRLGEGVDKTRALAAGAVERTLACLSSYAEVVAAARVSRLDAVGTSAMRDAAGGSDFAERAQRLLGVRPRVISGDEEARLTFIGGLSGLALHARRVLVFDIGGGSTELIVGSCQPVSIEHAVSLDVGSVRLTERHLRSDPPTVAEIQALEADLGSALSTFEMPPVDAVVGVAGTVTSIAAIARKVDPYDASVIHGMRLSATEVRATSALLDRSTVAERTRLPGLSPKRADVIAAGGHICAAVLARTGAADLVVSDRGVRWGLLHAMTLHATKQPAYPRDLKTV
jgi:exopolyphosphatase/guanosine-5'-triphosphate,3'-diphosphate pyrophosphatase